MTRVRIGAARKRKHKKTLKAARGMRGAYSRRYALAKQKVFRSGVFATRDRRVRKREFRELWIVRLSAALRARGLRYSTFIAAMGDANITLNRKMLSEIAIADPAAFDAIVKAVTASAPKASAPKA